MTAAIIIIFITLAAFILKPGFQLLAQTVARSELQPYYFLPAGSLFFQKIYDLLQKIYQCSTVPAKIHFQKQFGYNNDFANHQNLWFSENLHRTLNLKVAPF